MRLQHTRTLAGKGERTDQFRVRLTGIAVDADDNLLAVGDREVKQFSPDGSFGLCFSTRDAGWSVAVDGQSILVGMQGSVDRFDRNGRFIDAIEEPNRLGIITAIVAKGETLVVADATHRTIHFYVGGIWRTEIGSEVNTRGFMIPNGILDLAAEVDGESLLVAHPQKHRVERYGMSGELIEKFGRFGAENPADFGGCCNPTNVAALDQDRVVVSEKAPPKLKVFTADGRFVTQAVGMFDPTTKNIDLAVDRNGRIYATDPARCTIEVFEQEAASG